MAGEIIPTKDRIRTVRGLVERYKPQLLAGLAKHINQGLFLQGLFTEAMKTPDLGLCTPASLLGAMMQGGQLGLYFGPLNQLFLVPFNDSRLGKHLCTLIIGYRGMVQLAHRSDSVLSTEARVVHAADHFDWEYGTARRLTHRPGTEVQGFDPCEFCGRRLGPVVAAYALIGLTGGGIQFRVMDRKQLEAIRARSRAKAGPWRGGPDVEEMMAKTPFRAEFKYCPSSVEMQTAITLDELADSDLPQQIDAPFVSDELGEDGRATTALDRLTEKMAGQPAKDPSGTPPDQLEMAWIHVREMVESKGIAGAHIDAHIYRTWKTKDRSTLSLMQVQALGQYVAGLSDQDGSTDQAK